MLNHCHSILLLISFRQLFSRNQFQYLTLINRLLILNWHLNSSVCIFFNYERFTYYINFLWNLTCQLLYQLSLLHIASSLIFNNWIKKNVFRILFHFILFYLRLFQGLRSGHTEQYQKYRIITQYRII